MILQGRDVDGCGCRASEQLNNRLIPLQVPRWREERARETEKRAGIEAPADLAGVVDRPVVQMLVAFAKRRRSGHDTVVHFSVKLADRR